MAKLPGRGRGKTRLAAALDDDARVALSQAMIEDKVDQLLGLRDVATPYVAFAPQEEAEQAERWLGGRIALIPQRDGDLGERLFGVLVDLFERHGHDGVILVDADTPTLPPAYLHEAVRALSSGEVDVVLGPAWDGGYYALGLCSARRSIFASIPWSTRDVLARTVEIAEYEGLAVHFLPAWYDVDTPADLAVLASDVAPGSRFAPGYPARTAALLHRPLESGELEAREWRTLSRRRVYRNAWMDVTERVVAVPSPREQVLTLYGVVSTGRCVGIVPRTADGRVLMVRQFRYVAQRFTLEIPTGGVHAGETLLEAAMRELREECNVTAAGWRSICTYHTSKSVVEEEANLFVADELSPAAGDGGDPTESFEVIALTFDEALARVRSGEIVDSMSIIALQALALGHEQA